MLKMLDLKFASHHEVLSLKKKPKSQKAGQSSLNMSLKPNLLG